jgi:hypothetical protein
VKNVLIAIGIIAAALLLLPRGQMTSPHDAGPNGQATSRAPFPCELDHSIECTWEQYQQIANENCAKDRAQGGRCDIVTNSQSPHAVHIPSESDRAEMGRKLDDTARRLCDNLANAGYGCHVSRN